MNTLSTPKVANLLDRLHQEAAEQMPSVRAAMKQIRSEQTSPEEWPSIEMKGGTEYSLWTGAHQS